MRSTDTETELERLREENRRLRSLLEAREQTQEVSTAAGNSVVPPKSAGNREELDQQARLFDTVLSSIVDFAYTFDRAGRFTYINQALLDLWQLRLEDARGKNFHELNYPPELADRLQQQIETVFTTGRKVLDETPYTGADGTTRYYEYIFVPVFGRGEQVEVVAGTTRDITHRKRAEQVLQEHTREIEALNGRLKRSMTETHHRVKNNLQMVSALMELQRQDAGDTIPLSELIRLKQNIQALSVIHEILTQEAKDEGDAAFLSIKSVMDQFLPILQATLGERRLMAEVEELSVSGKQATSLAIIANELVSNAMKHGKGEIELTLQARDSLATLEVCDDGPGFDVGFDPATAAHTGLELIENIARYDLRGETVYENREEGGARITVVFPIQLPITH